MKKAILSCVTCFVASLLLLSTIGAVAYAETDISQPKLAESIDRLMSTELEKLHIPGAAVVVTKGNSIFFSKGYGYADVDKKMLMDPAKTIVSVGSLTKSLTATAAMQLVERNQLSLNEDVNRFLTSYQTTNYHGEPFTLHHLLTHTAGLDESLYEFNSLSEENKISATEYLRTYFQNQPPTTKPGTHYEYSNASFGLIGNMIEQVSGQSLNDYMKTHLFKPLDMPSAMLTIPLDNPALATSYTPIDGGYQAQPHSFLNLPGAGALNVIPNEFVHYLIAHLHEGQYQNQTILKPETVATMHKKQFAINPEMDGLGYGFFRGHLQNETPMLYTTGLVDGFVSEMVLIPSESIGVFVITNTDAPGFELHSKVIDAVTSFLPANKQASIMGVSPDISATTSEEMAGVYQLSLNPTHGWGKWIRTLGGFSFTVHVLDQHTITVEGIFHDKAEKQVKEFTLIDDGAFQEKNGPDKLYIAHQSDGWKLTAPDNQMLKKASIWHQTRTLFVTYAIASLFFISILLIWIVRYVVRFFKKGKNPISGRIALIAALNTVFHIFQITYGNKYVAYGYSPWFIWVICILPIVAAVLAIILFLRKRNQARRGRREAIWKAIFALITLLHTFYLLYWNFLPLHFYVTSDTFQILSYVTMFIIPD